MECQAKKEECRVYPCGKGKPATQIICVTSGTRIFRNVKGLELLMTSNQEQL
jgi:hypothetical protein